MKTLSLLFLCFLTSILSFAKGTEKRDFVPDSLAKQISETSPHNKPKLPPQHKNVMEVHYIQLVNEGIDYPLIISILVAFISVLAIILPLRASRLSEKRQIFFQFYDRWNSERLLKCREGFWATLDRHKQEDGKVHLYPFSLAHRQDYYRYETIYDILYDIAVLYDQNLIERKLVDVHLQAFIHSYTEALETRFLFHDCDDRQLVKMREDHYKPVITKLNNRIPVSFQNQ